MKVDEIIEKLRDGYILEHAPVTGGQCLRLGSYPIINHISLSFTEFNDATNDPRVVKIDEWTQGHPVFHGRVIQYGLG